VSSRGFAENNVCTEVYRPEKVGIDLIVRRSSVASLNSDCLSWPNDLSAVGRKLWCRFCNL